MEKYTEGMKFVQGNIYLKIVDGNIEAYGDLDSLEDIENKARTGRLFDYALTSEEWEAACYTARMAKNGEVVLGLDENERHDMHVEAIRVERDDRLKVCDLISPMRWNAMTQEQKNVWTKYRQDLLDIPQQNGFPWGGDPDKVPWPKKPE